MCKNESHWKLYNAKFTKDFLQRSVATRGAAYCLGFLTK